jgi:predicted dehydrogenase
MNFAIVGCGLIGRKRVQAFRPTDRLLIAADLLPERAEALVSGVSGARATVDWKEVLSNKDVDSIIVATTNEWLAPIAIASLEAHKHVLVEKPAARSSQELDQIIRAATKSGMCVHVGFNHRYHPAIRKAHEIWESGALGPLMFIRGRYGHGGRIGYEREWRADRKLAGGGELIDQGVHLIDLARWFLGEFVSVCGHVHRYFWNMPVEDNAFISLRTNCDQTAWLHVSCTEWKNLFSFEIYGRVGKLQIEGLGGSYGTERLTFYKMLPEMGPPETTSWEYPGEDISWKHELHDFIRAVQAGGPTSSTLHDARAVLDVVQRVYDLSTNDHHA